MPAAASPDVPLAQRLGFAPEDRVLIVNGDDAGLCHAANAATFDAMAEGLVTSATVMVPCAWFPEAAAYARARPDADVGVHLTHTCETKGYRWGPVAPADQVPSLLDPDGYLWPSLEAFYRHADPAEAALEARAQIDRALAAGLDVTHLDSHMGALQFDLRFYQVYRQLALNYRLPIRMASQQILADAGAPALRAELAGQGVAFPDRLIFGERQPGEAIEVYWKRMLRGLQPGVTELYIHAAYPGPEIEHVVATWKDRVRERELFTTDPEIRAILDDLQVKRIGYRPLRALQRQLPRD